VAERLRSRDVHGLLLLISGAQKVKAMWVARIQPDVHVVVGM
jgi:hypothetical protein